MKRLNKLCKQYYILAVVALSLQQDFFAAVSLLASLEQQVLPFAHFFFLPLSVDAKATPAVNKATEANNNTFFIMLFCLINQRKNKAVVACSQGRLVKISG